MTSQAEPARLKRSESFLGIHFDFHAWGDCTEVGKNVTEEMVESIIDQVRPDYIQVDSKGHAGIASFPTKVGTATPGFVKDQLRIWREVTARRGVALYAHYSGVFDCQAVKLHEDWARVTEEGKGDPEKASVFGPYVDELLIPQLEELCDDYGLDGVWVDGECWATGRDYGPGVLEAFRRQTGIENVPRKPEDPNFFEFNQFCREGFRKYMRHYVDAMHRHNRRFQIASNWAFTSFMPEPVSADVDFLSGDYSPGDSVNSARFEGRCIAPQGKPWDLMAWSFNSANKEICWSTKSLPQLQREAAMVLSLGGGFQAYFQQNRDASVNLWQMKLMGEVAKFCRERQPFCHRGVPVPQIALANSTADYYRRSNSLFANWEYRALRGTLQALLESQNCVEILSEHHLAGRMKDYPLIILPELRYIEPGLRADLLAYVEGGGSLLVIEPVAAASFQRELDVELLGKPAAERRWLEHDGWLGGVLTTCQRAKVGPKAQAFGVLHETNALDSPASPTASIATHGKGRIAAIYFNFGDRYAQSSTATARRFLGALVRRLFADPIVEVTGSQFVDVTVNRIGGKLAVNLVNTAGPHDVPTVAVFDEIPPVGPLNVTIRTSRKPSSVMLQPAGTKLDFDFTDGCVRLVLPQLAIHDIVVVEP
jgi:hypothetical protein